ncbi:MAG: sulfur carrier protein ThiS [Rikenellaceae bacterium]
MNIILNHKDQTILSNTIEGLIDELSIETKGVAIALNNKVIPRNKWSLTKLNNGDKVVIVSAVFGG